MAGLRSSAPSWTLGLLWALYDRGAFHLPMTDVALLRSFILAVLRNALLGAFWRLHRMGRKELKGCVERHAVLGAGGVGRLVGDTLVKARQPVTLVVRPGCRGHPRSSRRSKGRLTVSGARCKKTWRRRARHRGVSHSCLRGPDRGARVTAHELLGGSQPSAVSSVAFRSSLARPWS